ncbi:MAG: hypothetical protein IJT43_01455 [Stomatobaculum sp.]|nr:hypothetical protein [Stomatobaculum sp.]
MKGTKMRRNHLLKHTALLFLAGALLTAMPLSVSANTDVGKGASKKYTQNSSESKGPGGSAGAGNSQGTGGNWQETQVAGGAGTDPGVITSSPGVKETRGGSYAYRDQEAPAATGAYGYSREDAQAVCEYLYGMKTDPVKKEIAKTILMNSIWYDPENIMKESGGKSLLKIYEGPKGNYNKAYLEALDGLEFFPNPTVMFLQTGEGTVIVAVETNGRFTEEQAASNFGTIRSLVPMIEEMKAATAQKDAADTAKYISDYVARVLEYDDNYGRNSLGDAIRYGRTACVGYNSLTELLFEHCGLPYISVVADETGSDASHIFGVSKVKNSWLVFDITNYDREGGNEPFWIFSDKYREGQYYSNFRMVETPDGLLPEG